VTPNLPLPFGSTTRAVPSIERCFRVLQVEAKTIHYDLHALCPHVHYACFVCAMSVYRRILIGKSLKSCMLLIL